MLLAVDIGNTNIVFAAHDGESWVHHWRVQTVKEKMPDEYGLLFHAFLREAAFDTVEFEQVVLGSVVPPVTWKIEQMLQKQTGRTPLVISHLVETGLTFRVKNPAEVGADLIADAVAAYARFGGACISVDFGTATTFVAVSDRAEFLGVAIAPGANLMAASLAGGTSQLPQIALELPESAIGTDTVSALSAGIMLGYLGLIERLITRIRQEMAERGIAGPIPVVATGGLGPFIAPLTACFEVYDPWHTLNGMRLIALRNSESRECERS